MGPFTPVAHEVYKYASKITDQFSTWATVYLLCSKDQALASLQVYVASTMIPFSSRIVRLHADKSGEYTGKAFQAYCLESGIKQELAATNTPQQISVSERVGRMLYATVCCLLVDSDLPPNLWGELMLIATYLCNRVPHSAPQMGTSHKVLYGKDAGISHLNIVGVRAFVYIENPTKLGDTSEEGMVYGLTETESNSYRVWDPGTQAITEPTGRKNDELEGPGALSNHHGCCHVPWGGFCYDIYFAFNQLARAMAKPSKVHMRGAKHLLRYLAGSVNVSISYKRGGFKLTAYSDANWGNNLDNGKSRSLCIVMLANGPISFKMGLQSLTAQSTMEVELVAGVLTMKEAVVCSNMIVELGFEKGFICVPLYLDNTSTFYIAGNRIYSPRATR